jgi:hypothetical protein
LLPLPSFKASPLLSSFLNFVLNSLLNFISNFLFAGPAARDCCAFDPGRGHREFQGANEGGAALAEFRAMVKRQLAKDSLAPGGERNQNLSAILATGVPPHQACGRKTVDEFDRTVMPDLKPLGELADPGTRAFGQTFQSQHELMLLRFEACITGRLLAEVEKAAQLITDFRQGFIVGCGARSLHAIAG